MLELPNSVLSSRWGSNRITHWFDLCFVLLPKKAFHPKDPHDSILCLFVLWMFFRASCVLGNDLAKLSSPFIRDFSWNCCSCPRGHEGLARSHRGKSTAGPFDTMRQHEMAWNNYKMKIAEGTIASKGHARFSRKPPWPHNDLPQTHPATCIATLRRNQSLFKRSWSSQGGTNNLPICFLQTFADGLQVPFEFVISCDIRFSMFFQLDAHRFCGDRGAAKFPPSSCSSFYETEHSLPWEAMPVIISSPRSNSARRSPTLFIGKQPSGDPRKTQRENGGMHTLHQSKDEESIVNSRMLWETWKLTVN